MLRCDLGELYGALSYRQCASLPSSRPWLSVDNRHPVLRFMLSRQADSLSNTQLTVQCIQLLGDLDAHSGIGLRHLQSGRAIRSVASAASTALRLCQVGLVQQIPGLCVPLARTLKIDDLLVLTCSIFSMILASPGSLLADLA